MGVRAIRCIAAAGLAGAFACGPQTTSPGGGPGDLPVIGDSAVTIGPNTGEATRANGINDSNFVAGIYVDLTSTQFGWLSKNGVLSSIVVNIPGAFNTAPQAINDSNDVVGYYTLDTSNHAFIYDGVGYATFDYPGAAATEAFGINANGVIVGTYFMSGSANGHAFKRTGATYTNIDPPAAASAAALGINSLGDIVGEYVDSTGNVHGYLWTHGAASPTVLSYSGVSSVLPYGINDALTIVGSAKIGSSVVGFMAKGSAVTLIEVPGAGATEAFGINNAGVIVGVYVTTAQFGFGLVTQ